MRIPSVTSTMWLGAVVGVLMATLLASAQTASDELAIAQLVGSFRETAFENHPDRDLMQVFADDYVHIGADGAMTTSWRVLQNAGDSTPVTTEKLHVRVFGELAVASYLWRLNGSARTTSVMHVFLNRQGGWRIIATQVGGPNPSHTGPIMAAGSVAPRNPSIFEKEIQETLRRFADAVNLRTPQGERAEDVDTIRSIFAEDAIYIEPNGNALTREQVLLRGHPNAVQLSGGQLAGAVVVPDVPEHIDRHLAVFGTFAVWTSRNPANGDQSLRVWQKRTTGWQMIAIHHGMSYRRRP